MYFECILNVPFFLKIICKGSLVDECTFCLSCKAEGYTESTLIHKGCTKLICRLILGICIFQLDISKQTTN